MSYPSLPAFDISGVLFASSLTIAVVWVLKLPTLARALVRRGKRKPLALSKRLQILALLSLAPAVFLLTLLALSALEQPKIKSKPTIVKITLLPEPVQPAKPSAPTPEPTSKPEQRTEPKPPAKPPASASKPVPKAQTRPAEATRKMDTELARLLAAARLARFETFPAPAPAHAEPPARAKPQVSDQTQAISQVACVFCPELDYPALAKRRGWQGSVLLEFQLTPEGLAQNIVVARSSGYGPLDTAAIANVRTSRFTRNGSGGLRMATREFHFELK